jgi:uncharacterized protein YgiM (DUF1202 family)
MECRNRKQKTDDRNRSSVVCRLPSDLCRLSSVVCPLFIVIVVTLASVCLSQQATVPEKPALIGDANTPGVPVAFPYLAEIVGDDVNMRSGPGTNYYACAKLYRGDKVKVAGSQSGWSRIVAPAGSYSWISMRCIGVSLNNPAEGLITGDGVCVYAGSDDVLPMHSTSEQATLKRGDKVKLVGQEKDDYYKIVPPEGACLWVSTQYIKPLAPADQTPSATVTVPDSNAVAPAKTSVEAEKLNEYYTIQKQVEAERAKPAAQQNYTSMKEALKAIAANKGAGKAARYAEFTIKQIERYELALTVAKEVQLQTEKLQQTSDQIDKTRAAKLAEIKDLGRFAVIGQFQSSAVYGSEAGAPGTRYRIIDKSGKIMCYAVAAGQTAKTDLSKLIGKKVGLVGTIEPPSPTAVALVRFTEIVELK